MPQMMRLWERDSVIIVGGAGFIGSHLASRLWEPRIYDLQLGDDARDLKKLTTACIGCDTLIHLASNADIALASSHPMVDFDNGTAITAVVVEAARLSGVQRILYASGSGVYGDCGSDALSEDERPLRATSPYGASKIAGEALISAYCEMFGMTGIAFRFANVVGPNQTHGVGYDFIRKLKDNPNVLEILGDGRQQKSYVYIDDVLDAVLMSNELFHGTFTAYNVSTADSLTVREIAHMAARALNVQPTYRYTGGRGGWNGDIPVVRLDSQKIARLGWRPQYTSSQAMAASLEAMAW